MKKLLRPIPILLMVLWLCASGFGLWILIVYQISAGASSPHPLQWPQKSSIQRAVGKSTLILFAHPHCPCSRASIGELAWVMARARQKVQAYVLVLKPAGFPLDWEKTDIWKNAFAIPGVQTVCDQSGGEAKRFSALTSGQTILYDLQGQLVFSGGITGSRGHSGDNAGRDAVLSFLQEGRRGDHSRPLGIDQQSALQETPVFGCSLFVDPQSMDKNKLWKI